MEPRPEKQPETPLGERKKLFEKFISDLQDLEQQNLAIMVIVVSASGGGPGWMANCPRHHARDMCEATYNRMLIELN